MGENLCPRSATFTAVKARMAQLPEEQRELLLEKKVLEIVEDEPVTDKLLEDLGLWREQLGFSRKNFSVDDMVGDLAAEVLGDSKGTNYHTVSACKPLMPHVGCMKIDMHWAKLIFLSFPGWSVPTAQKALQGARENR